MINLDFFCMKAAQAIASGAGEPRDKENVATKALGVLLENGPYGLALYLETAKVSCAAQFKRGLLDLLRQEQVATYLVARPPEGEDLAHVTKWLTDLASNLDSYLFVKRLWQQTLTYVRYLAKALSDDPAPERATVGAG